MSEEYPGVNKDTDNALETAESEDNTELPTSGDTVECRICGEQFTYYVSELERHMQGHRPSEVERAALNGVNSA